MRIPLFRIFYSTTFTLIFLVLLGLLVITPADSIYQSRSSNRFVNITILAVIYLVTFLTTVFVYATRVYTTRTHLSSIPRAWIPIVKKSHISRSVRHMINANLERSASIAYHARPRDLRKYQNATSSATKSKEAQPLHPGKPHWGKIAHPGWSPPDSEDLPNLQYEPVVLELPHLIEAKAVSLAPPDPLSEPDSSTPLPDPSAVELLQRPAALNLRAYLTHLTTLSMIHPPDLTPTFLSQYEHARFSNQPLTESLFRSLMSTFATILRTMTSPDPEILASMASDFPSYTTSSASQSISKVPRSDHDSMLTTDTVEHTPYHTPMPAYGFDAAPHSQRPNSTVQTAPQTPSNASFTSLPASTPSSPAGTVRTAHSRNPTRHSSRLILNPTSSRPNSPFLPRSFLTFNSPALSPSLQRPSRSRMVSARETQSRSGYEQSPQPSMYRTPSENTQRSVASSSGSSSKMSGGSVIRLREGAGVLDLPYVLVPEWRGEEGDGEGVRQRRRGARDEEGGGVVESIERDE